MIRVLHCIRPIPGICEPGDVVYLDDEHPTVRGTAHAPDGADRCLSPRAMQRVERAPRGTFFTLARFPPALPGGATTVPLWPDGGRSPGGAPAGRQRRRGA